MVKPGRILQQLAMVMVALMGGLFSPLPGLAHFQVFWPQTEGCYAKPGEAVKWQYFWGHPFEMLIDDAQAPKFFIFTPDKKKESLSPSRITLKDQASGKDRQA